MAHRTSSELPAKVFQTLGTLTLNQLKMVARKEGLAVSGAKAALQDRIKNRLNEYHKANDAPKLERLVGSITHAENTSQSLSTNHQGQLTKGTPQHHKTVMSNGLSRTLPSYESTTASLSQRIVFKESPFYTILSPLMRVQECKVRESTRDSIECLIEFTADVAQKFARHSSNRENARIMIYCTADPISAYANEIAFPTQIEIKVNGHEVKANFRGLKNKPGSTRPVDITGLVRKSPQHENNMLITYALTNKKYYLIVNLVDQHPAGELVEKLKSGRPITKQQVINEMRNKAEDSEVKATASIMSLKCPLSTLRIQTPCRSAVCSHNQCFDALSFLQLQQQGPTWTCPICNVAISFEQLRVDEYVDHILKATSSVDQVFIQPNGDWSAAQQNTQKSVSERAKLGSSDDDLIEIQGIPGLDGINPEKVAMGVQTPLVSREQSIASAARSSNTKRPHSAVIDLTASSDEEDQLQNTKRQSRFPSSPRVATSEAPQEIMGIGREGQDDHRLQELLHFPSTHSSQNEVDISPISQRQW